MAVQDAFIIVEGPQDAECIARLLAVVGYDLITQVEGLSAAYRRQFSAKFPVEGRGINQRHEVPHFLKNAVGCTVAIIIAGGDSKLARALMSSVEAFQGLPGAVGFVLDDDQEPLPTTRYSSLLAKMTVFDNLKSLRFPTNPGEILVGSPRAGAFVMPDNQRPGTLEDILLEAGEIAYATQITAAREFVQTFPTGGLTEKELQAGKRPSGVKKQTTGTVATMLKPGRTLQVSLQDNRWLTDDALRKPLVLELRRWLHLLLDIPTP